MTFKTEHFRGEAQEPISFTSESGTELFEKIKDIMVLEIKERNLPATVRVEELKSGGIFGSKVPLLLINNTDPSCRYFTIGIFVNGSTVCFPLLGESAENTKYNKKKFYEDNGNYLMAKMIKPDELKLQQESTWQYQVLDCLNSYIN